MKLEKIKKMSEKQLSQITEKSEYDIQCEIINYCRLNKILCFAVPNEATRNNSKYIKSGVLSGVSDLILVIDKVSFVEVKNRSGKQSEKQKEFQNKVELLGFKYYLVRSLDDFKKLL